MSPLAQPPSRRQILKALLVGAIGVTTAELASCTSGPRSHIVDVTAFGAKGDGHTDDYAAIVRALASLRSGQSLRFPDGVFCHASAISVSTPGVTLLGPGTLRATAEQSSALKILADGVRLDGLTVAMGTTTQRWASEDQHKIFIGPYSGVSLTDVRIDGSAAAGLFSFGATDFRYERVRVADTRADGIHMTNGSRNGTVVSPQITRSGDDGVAVVSYLDDDAPCGHITISAPQVRTTTGGRGVSVVGGHDVSYRDIDIADSFAAAVYIACEGGDFLTRSTQRVSVTGGRITGANTDAAIDHGAVLIYSGRSGGQVRDVTVTDLTITDTRATASRQIGAVADSADDLVSAVTFRDLRLAATPTPYQGDAPDSSLALDDVTAAGRPVTLPS